MQCQLLMPLERSLLKIFFGEKGSIFSFSHNVFCLMKGNIKMSSENVSHLNNAKFLLPSIGVYAEEKPGVYTEGTFSLKTCCEIHRKFNPLTKTPF